jgi:hypothetical protein
MQARNPNVIEWIAVCSMGLKPANDLLAISRAKVKAHSKSCVLSGH